MNTQPAFAPPLPPMIHQGKPLDWREWLLTNDLGSFALGTFAGIHTRRYHALFTVAAQPPVNRVVALHSTAETLQLAPETQIPLTIAAFGTENQTLPEDAPPPSTLECDLNHQRLTIQFHAPLFTINRSLQLFPGQQRARLEWSVMRNPESDSQTPPNDAPSLFTPKLVIRMFTPLRDFHALDHAHPAAEPDFQPDPTEPSGHFRLSRDGVTIAVHPFNLSFQHDPQWWHNFNYAIDHTRGQDHQESVWSPGTFHLTLPRSSSTAPALASLELTLIDPRGTAPRSVSAGFTPHTPAPPAQHATADPLVALRAALNEAARAFVVNRRLHTGWAPTILAGYPWFADWGRDTMIALPGLMLHTNRLPEACLLLENYASRMNDGLLPNVFSDYEDHAAYNTVDASLWFVHAIRQWSQAARAQPTPVMATAIRQIIQSFQNGTRYNIHVDPHDHLLNCGDGGDPITWMDAKRDGIAFTPRDGKPVEINALWCNAIHTLAQCTDDPEEARALDQQLQRTVTSFREQFIRPDGLGLYDRIKPLPGPLEPDRWEPDPAIRPNQLFAVSLPFSPLEETAQRAVVETARERLFTPFGMRTLDPTDPGYKPRYQGNMFERDAAYHNGTAWPWLLGPYVEACLNVHQHTASAKEEIRDSLQPLFDAILTGAAGTIGGGIAEVYDADPPHRPQGCPAQAWSVAELIRIASMLTD